MKLRNISIKNFRNLRNVNIRLSKTTVIIGENNAGKSNLLYALRLLFDPQAERLRLDLSADDINDTARSVDEKNFSIRVEIGDLQEHPELEVCFRERIATDGPETFVTIEGRYELDSDGVYEWRSYVLPPDGRYNDPIPMSRRMARALPLYFLDAVRDAARDTRATGRGLLSQLLNDLDYSDVQQDIQSYLKDANAALNRGQEVSKLASGLTRELTSLVPGGQSEVTVAVADENLAHLTRNFRLNVRKNPNLPQTDLSRHGTGLQNLTLVAMFRHSVNTVQTGNPILAIEEPEAHLHPHAQRRLFKDLLKINAPVVMTTHSPEIVKYSDPKNLVLLRATAPDETCTYQLGTSLSEQDSKGLEQLMRGGRAEIFFARSIIIVEGQSELIALPAFAEALGCDLDRDGISLVSADGNNYAFILRACASGQFEIPIVVTYDTDVLSTSHTSKFLRPIRDLGLITPEEFQAHKSHTNCPDSARKALLTGIGWIGAEECFEEVVCHSGYLDVVIQTVENITSSQDLTDYLTRSGYNRDPNGLVQFIKFQEKEQSISLKIPVARAVAEAVSSVKRVPECYAHAIQRATLLSLGGIKVDESFELNACAAGFLTAILEKINAEGLTSEFERQFDKDAKGVARFFTEAECGRKIRQAVKDAVAAAVGRAGLPEYAQAIRDQPFPQPVSESANHGTQYI